MRTKDPKGIKFSSSVPDKRVCVIWFFERQAARLHYEIRRQSDGPAYELVITFPDGRQETERYEDSNAITRRSIRLERALTDAGWEPPAGGLRGGSY
jgi:hypothetical protein